jgi:hypothetical protein
MQQGIWLVVAVLACLALVSCSAARQDTPDKYRTLPECARLQGAVPGTLNWNDRQPGEQSVGGTSKVSVPSETQYCSWEDPSTRKRVALTITLVKSGAANGTAAASELFDSGVRSTGYEVVTDAGFGDKVGHGKVMGKFGYGACVVDFTDGNVLAGLSVLGEGFVDEQACREPALATARDLARTLAESR